MTRLQAQDMATIARDLDAYERSLRTRTGLTLRGLACRAAGVEEHPFTCWCQNSRSAVVPLTCGQGAIAGFAESVQRILAHLGLPATVTAEPDAAGLAAAYADHSDLVFLADDQRFIAIDTRSREIVDNADATGAGFAWGLVRMAGRLDQRPVLVLGCGPVGRSAGRTVLRVGGRLSLCDLVPEASGQAARLLSEYAPGMVSVESDLESALARHRLIIDATPAADLIDEAHIHPDTFISAPGVPLGLTARAVEKISNRLLHDRLEIGVATMAAMALALRMTVRE
ncbi:MAG: 3-methylornithyl-N6-L-lysine dehydrogenase PylD [Hyphomicrobiales bacterium]